MPVLQTSPPIHRPAVRVVRPDAHVLRVWRAMERRLSVTALSGETPCLGAQNVGGAMTIWELAAKAAAEVEKWPLWKRNAADLALTTPKEDRRRPKGAKSGSQRGLAGGIEQK